jgi:hypothetical protein
MAILVGTLAVALFNASKDDVARYFAYFYAVISVGVLVSFNVPCLNYYVRTICGTRRYTVMCSINTESP